MQTDLRLQCLQCLECMGTLRPLSHERWKCDACDRGGVFTRGKIGDREVVVRVVTRWRNGEGQVRHG